MSAHGKPQCLIFIDIAAMELASLAAFLEELAHKQAKGEFPAQSPCHWIVDPRTLPRLWATDHPGAQFLRERERWGDGFFPVNLSAQDWNALFPEEAVRDGTQTLQLMGSDLPLFLKHTPTLPAWADSIPHNFLLMENLKGVPHLINKRGHDFHPIPLGHEATTLHWLVPASIMTAPLPPQPWGSLGSVNAKKPLVCPVPDLSPGDKLRFHKTAEVRKEAHTKNLVKDIFFVNKGFPGLGTKEAVDFEETLGGIRKRALVSSMQGTCDMKEGELAIRFQGGHLARILTDQGGEICSQARSFMEWKGKRRFFETNSAFTLEGDFSFGLRESLVLRDEDLGEPARMIIDYYFVEESPEFFVSITVRWPRWKEPTTVTAWAPLELTLFPVKEKNATTCRCLWPEASSKEFLLDLKSSGGTFAGVDFLFTSGNQALVLGFPQNQLPRPHHLDWTLTKKGSQKLLTLNPEGGYHPRASSEWEGVEEHFSFYLTLPPHTALPFAPTRKQASELIPPYVRLVDGDSVSP